jgi:hypothetical protein
MGFVRLAQAGARDVDDGKSLLTGGDVHGERRGSRDVTDVFDDLAKFEIKVVECTAVSVIARLIATIGSMWEPDPAQTPGTAGT